MKEVSIDNLKVGQEFYTNTRIESPFIFLFKSHDIVVFSSKNKEYLGASSEVEEIYTLLKHKLSDGAITKIKESMLDLDLRTVSWLGVYRGLIVSIKFVKNNKLNRKLYPDNKITECKKYINL